MNIDTTAAAAVATTRGTGPYLSVAQVAERYGVSTVSVWRWSVTILRMPCSGCFLFFGCVAPIPRQQVRQPGYR